MLSHPHSGTESTLPKTHSDSASQQGERCLMRH